MGRAIALEVSRGKEEPPADFTVLEEGHGNSEVASRTQIFCGRTKGKTVGTCVAEI
jgi:hypothetical protein